MISTNQKAQFTKKHLLWLILVVVMISVVIVGSQANKTVPSRIQTAPQAAKLPCHGETTSSIKDLTNLRTDAPLQTNLTTDQTREKLTINGQVTDTHCKAVAHALITIWQADAIGNASALKGKQYTNAAGMYSFITVMPTAYQQHAPHINVSVHATDQSPTLVTQLFFPDESQNKTDPYYDDSLLFSVHRTPQGPQATYNFIVEQ